MKSQVGWLLAVAFALVGCTEADEPADGSGGGGGEPAYDGPPIPWAYSPFPAAREPADNPSTPEKLALGNLLFYDPVLSGDDATACATCHSEIWGMSDGLPVSVGILGEGPTGPGRDGPNKTTRNAQTLWNVAFREELFWDGRKPSLEEQALEPLRAERELGLDPELAVAKLAAIPEYASLFASAFPDDAQPVSSQNIARALSVFQRTLVSDMALYDQYVAGDEEALLPNVRDGMFLFAEGGCARCHVPPLFDSQRYEARLPVVDAGRETVTGDPNDRGAFLIPTLRNSRDSEPFFHDGSVMTLREAVRVEADISAARGEGRALTDEEVELVTKFIDKALTDRTRDPKRPKEVPSGLDVPEDGFRVFR
ncbi:MAG: hypothetical protein HOV80_11095 [Polyangiaceae bacterium]|nr:hypothetical protein [Polyangiaceae bacterium]